ncbi:hypothetical protein CR513_58434, partial [Mucuna pruriens]
MISIFSELLENCMEMFMDDFTVYSESFDTCLENLSRFVYKRLELEVTYNITNKVQTKGMNLVNPSSTSIAKEEWRWFTSYSQDAEDQVHQSAT